MAHKKHHSKRLRGRPSAYDDRIKPRLAKIEKATKQGASRQEIAKLCGVSVSTLADHANSFSELAEALRGGDDAACEIVEAALFKRAIGYHHPAVKIMAVSQGEGMGSSIEKVEFTQHYPPDTQAAAFFLTNRKPKAWKQKIEHAPEDGKPWPVRIVLSADIGEKK